MMINYKWIIGPLKILGDLNGENKDISEFKEELVNVVLMNNPLPL